MARAAVNDGQRLLRRLRRLRRDCIQGKKSAPIAIAGKMSPVIGPRSREVPLPLTACGVVEPMVMEPVAVLPGARVTVDVEYEQVGKKFGVPLPL
jgi:hypothetical protein